MPILLYQFSVHVSKNHNNESCCGRMQWRFFSFLFSSQAFFQEHFLELHMCRTYFHGGREYLNIPFVQVCRSHQAFSFECLCTIVKAYLTLRKGAVSVELDTHEVCHHIEILDGQYVNIVKDITTPQQAINHFDRRFRGTWWYSPNLVNYGVLKLCADFEALKSKDKEMATRKRKFEDMKAGRVLN